MKRVNIWLLLLFIFMSALASTTHASQVTKPRVLMLISSYGSEDQPNLSYDLEELAQAYLILNDNGVSLDVASPKGGAVLVKNNKDQLAYIQRFKALALNKLQNTLPTKGIDLSQYQGVFIVGGGGAMMDLPTDPSTQSMLTAAVNQNLLITAVCHGPAALTNIKLKDGTYFVANKKVNSFTNVEERAFSSEELADFPFFIEDQLVKNGATFVYNKPMLPFVSVDQNLITAQNPSSVPKAAEMMVLKLGLKLKSRTPFVDESTMALLSQARSQGSGLIDLAIAKKTDVDLNYLALYGFYAYRLANEEDKPVELDLMAAIGQHFSHPEYSSQLIKALLEQGRIAQAQQAFRDFAKQFPEHEYINALQALVNP